MTAQQLPHPELSAHNHHGLSPLRCAVDAVSLPCVRLLLESKVVLNNDVDQKDDGYSPLTVACLSGAADIARAIVDAGALPQKNLHPLREITRAAPPLFDAQNFLALVGRMASDADVGLLAAALEATALLGKDGKRALAMAGSYRPLISALSKFNHHAAVVEKVVVCLNDEDMCVLTSDVRPDVALDALEKALTRHVTNPAVTVIAAKLAEAVLAGQWVDVCEEGYTVSLPAGSRVRYGKNGVWVERTLSARVAAPADAPAPAPAAEDVSVAATNETFGDPCVGIRKALQRHVWCEDSAPPHCSPELVDAVVNACRHIARWSKQSRAARADAKDVVDKRTLVNASRSIDLARSAASILSGVDVSELVRAYAVPMIINAVDAMLDSILATKQYDSLESFAKAVDALLAQYVRALPHVDASIVSSTVTRLFGTLHNLNQGFSKLAVGVPVEVTLVAERICGTVCVAIKSAFTLPPPSRDVAFSAALYSRGVGVLTQRLLSLTTHSPPAPATTELKKNLLVSLATLLAATPPAFAMPAATDVFTVVEQNHPKMFADFFVDADMTLRSHAASVLTFLVGTADRRIGMLMLEPDYTARKSVGGHPRLNVKHAVGNLLRTLNPDDVVSAAGVIKALGFSPAAFEGFKSEGVFRFLRAAAGARAAWSPHARAAAVGALSVFGAYAGAPTHAETEEAPEPLSVEDLQSTFDVWASQKQARAAAAAAAAPTAAATSAGARERVGSATGFARAISDRNVGWNDHLGALLAAWESARAIRVAAETPPPPATPPLIRIVAPTTRTASEGSTPPLSLSRTESSGGAASVSPLALTPAATAATHAVADLDMGGDAVVPESWQYASTSAVAAVPGISISTLDDGRIQLWSAVPSLTLAHHRDVLEAIGGRWDAALSVWTLPVGADLSFLHAGSSAPPSAPHLPTRSSAPNVLYSFPGGKGSALKPSPWPVRADPMDALKRTLRLAHAAVTSLPVVAKMDADKRARTVCVRNVPPHLSTLELFKVLSANGAVVALETDAPSSSFYASFDSTEAAQRALHADALPSGMVLSGDAVPPGAGLSASPSDFVAEIDGALTAVCTATTAALERIPTEWNSFVLQTISSLTPTPSAASLELCASRNVAATHLLSRLFAASRGQIYFNETMVATTHDAIAAAAAVDDAVGRSAPGAADALSIAEWMLKGRGVYEKHGRPHKTALHDGRFYCERSVAAEFAGSLGFAGGKACARCAPGGKCTPGGCQCRGCDLASHLAGHAPPPCAPADVTAARKRITRVASLVAPIVRLLSRGVDARTASGALLALCEAVRHNMVSEADGLAVAHAVEPFLAAADDAHGVVTNALAFLELAGSSHDGMSEEGSVAVSACVVDAAATLFRAALSPRAICLLVRVLFNATSRCADAHVLARLIGDGVSVVSIVDILNTAAAAATLSSAAASDDDANHWHWATCALYNLLAKSLHANEWPWRDQEVAVFLHAGVVECLVTAMAAEASSFKSATKARARHALFYLSLVSDAAKGRILTACPRFFEDFQLAAAGPGASTAQQPATAAATGTEAAAPAAASS